MSVQNSKVSFILKAVDAKGRVIVKCDRDAGFSMLTITKRGEDRFVIGQQPGSSLRECNRADVVAMLDSNRMYLLSWG